MNPDDPLRFYFWPIVGRYYRRRLELCLARCEGAGRILEVGYGSGLSFLNLGERYRYVHGIDLTARANQVAGVYRARGLDPHLLRGSVLNLPYAACSFDTVLLVSILEHLLPTDQAHAFSEIERVLKPGGTAVVGVPVDRARIRILFRLMGVDIREHHFSSERQVLRAHGHLVEKHLEGLSAPIVGVVYLVASFVKPTCLG